MILHALNIVALVATSFCMVAIVIDGGDQPARLAERLD
jgi:hypothetical protein